METDTVTVVYHFEDGSWWAETEAVPGFVAGGETLAEARKLAREGLAFALGHDVDIDERFDEQAVRARRADISLQVSGFSGEVRISTGSYTPLPERPANLQPSSLQGPVGSVASSRP